MKYIHLILVAVVIGAIVALSPLYAPLVQQALNPETPVQVEQPPQEHYVPVNITMMDESGEICINNSALGSYLSTLPAGTLTDEEKDGILYMREEEKLARDVYLTLYEKWDSTYLQT